MSLFKCYLCDHNFTQKHNLEKHLNDKKCKSQLINNWNHLNSLLEQLHKLKTNPSIINSPITIGNNNNNIKIEININPITKLDISHIEPSEMKSIIEKYDNDNNKLNILLGDYIKNMICDSNHPENQAVKYITKKPPTYNSTIEDSEGNTVNVIKDLKDTCELLSDPILDQLKLKLKECLINYKQNEHNEFDFSLYEDAFKELRKEFNKETVKKALKGVLKNDILHNIEMKFKLEP
jgi:hypothetical protein